MNAHTAKAHERQDQNHPLSAYITPPRERAKNCFQDKATHSIVGTEEKKEHYPESKQQGK